jgi:hypothetical protein
VEIPIITDFAAGLGASEWWAINGAFTDANMNPASTSLTYVGRTFDYYSRGAKLNDQDIAVRIHPHHCRFHVSRVTGFLGTG